MKGDKNKPLDSSQLHQGNDIEVSVRQPTSTPAPQEDQASHQQDENSVNVKVKSHPVEPSTYAPTLDDTEVTHVDDSSETKSYQPEIDIAEELKIEQKLEPVAVPAVTEPQAETKPAEIEPKPETKKPKSSAIKSTVANLNTPGVLVLQWLTYAFWGWTCLIMIWLTYVVSAHLIGGDQTSSEMSAYILAAVVVLLPLSIVCDWFYSRKESAKKSGVSMALMILHAVLFALLTIGALIIFMYSLVKYMLVPPSDLTEVYIMMLTSISVAVIYLAVFLRTLNPLPKWKLGLILSIFMFIVVTTLAIITVTGPINTQKSIQQDSETAEQLTNLVADLNLHAQKNGELPANLSSTSFAGKDNPLVVGNLVEYTKYKPTIDVASTTTDNSLPEFKDGNRIADDSEYLKLPFQLCVTYKVDTSDEYAQPLAITQPSEHFYAEHSHKAGKNCYELYAVTSSSH